MGGAGRFLGTATIRPLALAPGRTARYRSRVMTTASLMAKIRAACSPATWSKGVELSRAGAVVTERQRQDGELELRVTAEVGKPSPLVSLYLEDAEWSCECPSREDACVHVAAAAIALSRARSEGKPLPAAQADVAKVGYRLERTPQGLSFGRVLLSAAGESPLETTLAASKVKVAATEADLAIEVVLGTRLGGALPRETWARLWPKLAEQEVRLDGQLVSLGAPSTGMVCLVEDCAEGVRLRLEQDREVSELFQNGLLRTAETLRLVKDPGLSGAELQELRAGKIVPRAALASLVSERLPQLEKRVPLVVHARSLPSAGSEPPRLVVEVEPAPGGMSLLATVVYGRPPVARLDGDQLVSLGGRMPLRDRPREQVMQRRLREALDSAPGERRSVNSADVPRVLAVLSRLDAEVRARGGAALRPAEGLVPRLRFATGPDAGLDFELEFEVDGELGAGAGATPRRVGAAAALEAWEQGFGVLVLDDGTAAPLPADWLSRHGRLVVELLAARDEQAALAKASAPALVRLAEAMDVPPPPSLAGLARALEGKTAPPPAVLKGVLGEVLRAYQRQGVDWLCFLRDQGLGALLADDMGLGKTLQALASLRGKTLVVAPTSVLHNWRAEAQRFRPDLRVALFHGAKRALDPAADLVVTSYALLRLEADLLARQSWDIVVLDEAQNVKNPDSQVARAAFELGRRAAFRLALSGTPVENRLEELWSLMTFLNPGLLGARQDFAERYARPIARGDDEAAAALRAKTRPFVLRRTKRAVAPELPPRTEVVLRCELDEAERAVYDAVRAAAQANVLEKLAQGQGTLEALEALLRLRQASCHPALVPGQKAERSTKVDVLCEALSEAAAEGHKALVFSQWTSLLDLVEPHLGAAGLAFSRLDGSTVDRAGVVAGFQSDSGPPVMLVSLKAGGAGLNLTAADHVFLLDPWWNPAVEDQAADRAHRIGQTRPVVIHRLVAADTVEERIMGLQESKRALAAAALEEGRAGIGLTREELIELLA